MNLSPFRLIPLRWKLTVVAALSSRRAPAEFPAKGPRLIVALAADYGNLGDVALTRALLQFVERNLPSHRPYLLTAGRAYRDLKGVALASGPDDVVTLIGGGNMGDLYPDLEEARLRVVRAFPHNRIISFPQSIEFSDTASGRHALASSRKVYERHPRLQIFAREQESFARMRQVFPGAKISLAPDTVLSMYIATNESRNIPLMICLRQDKEAGITSICRNNLIATLCDTYPGSIIKDTLVEGPRLDYPTYELRLDAFLAQVSNTRCLVTDRLHGLIFSIITGTPCVVIENNNHKIRAIVESWLSDMPSVRLLTNPNPDTVLRAVKEVIAAPVSRPDFSAAFAPLVTALKV
jgi:pyruvyl transferase EpsI